MTDADIKAMKRPALEAYANGLEAKLAAVLGADITLVECPTCSFRHPRTQEGCHPMTHEHKALVEGLRHKEALKSLSGWGSQSQVAMGDAAEAIEALAAELSETRAYAEGCNRRAEAAETKLAAVEERAEALIAELRAKETEIERLSAELADANNMIERS